MSNKTKKITAIIVAAFFIFAFIVPILFSVFASASELEQRKQEAQSQIDALQKSNKDIMAEKTKADRVIKGIEENMSSIMLEINAHEAELLKLEAELKEASEIANTQYETLKKRMRVMYEQGADNYLDILLSSGSITNFFNRFEIIKQVAEYDSNRLDKLRIAVQLIEDATIEMEKIKEAKSSRLTAYQSEKSKLDQEQKNRDALIDENKQELSQLEKTLKEVEALQAKQRAEAAAKMSKNTKFVGGEMEWPTPGYYNITSPFGARFHPILKVNRMHSGIDIGAPNGVSVVAANDGTVIRATYSSSYGNYIIIDHGGGVATLYAHASSLSVSEGDKVLRGAQIMRVGSTGYSTGPHLHFEVIINGSNVDPSSYY